jgi:hypothetical protein
MCLVTRCLPPSDSDGTLVDAAPRTGSECTDRATEAASEDGDSSFRADTGEGSMNIDLEGRGSVDGGLMSDKACPLPGSEAPSSMWRGVLNWDSKEDTEPLRCFTLLCEIPLKLRSMPRIETLLLAVAALSPDIRPPK